VTPSGRRSRSTALAVLDAPSNLGLRPPADGVAPGVHKLAGALRDQRLVERLAAGDAGVVVPPRYRPDWDGRTPRNAPAVARYSARLADRIDALLAAEAFPVVLGGDCSILLGALLALRRRTDGGRADGGRPGLVFLDGHTDFRHPGNSPAVQAVAGEDLALACGLGHPLLAALHPGAPLVRTEDVVLLGVRSDDEHLPEVRGRGAFALTDDDVRATGAAAAAGAALDRLRDRGVDRFWIHVDADVVDPALLPAVDSPAPGGLDLAELGALLAALAAVPEAAGLEVTVLDPDLDETGEQAALLAGAVVGARRGLARPARRRVVA